MIYNKGKVLLFISALFIAACQGPDPLPHPFNVTTAFDGQWRGEGIVEFGPGCVPATMLGEIQNGWLRLRLVGYDTIMAGWISRDGFVQLTPQVPRQDYSFSGIATPDRIVGTWNFDGGACSGSWFLNRVS